jgi:hypothetical protein
LHRMPIPSASRGRAALCAGLPPSPRSHQSAAVNALVADAKRGGIGRRARPGAFAVFRSCTRRPRCARRDAPQTMAWLARSRTIWLAKSQGASQARHPTPASSAPGGTGATWK